MPRMFWQITTTIRMFICIGSWLTEGCRAPNIGEGCDPPCVITASSGMDENTTPYSETSACQRSTWCCCLRKRRSYWWVTCVRAGTPLRDCSLRRDLHRSEVLGLVKGPIQHKGHPWGTRNWGQWRDLHGSRDTPEGLQLIDNPCWST